MSVRADGSRIEANHFDGRELGRLTWIGLALAGIGWVLLLGETASVDVFGVHRPVVATFHADLADIAKCIVASGFGLAVVGALQTGFGALNRFFEAVLLRSAQRTMPAVAGASHGASHGHGPGAPVQSPVEREPSRAPMRRPYRLLADGSVEVDTILGTRLFKTMAEARDFI